MACLTRGSGMIRTRCFATAGAAPYGAERRSCNRVMAQLEQDGSLTDNVAALLEPGPISGLDSLPKGSGILLVKP